MDVAVVNMIGSILDAAYLGRHGGFVASMPLPAG